MDDSNIQAIITRKNLRRSWAEQAQIAGMVSNPQRREYFALQFLASPLPHEDEDALINEIIELRAELRDGLRYLDYLKAQIHNAIEDLQNPNYQHGGYGLGVPDGVSLKWVEGVIERLQAAREAENGLPNE
jgi:hypothetical protein